MFFSFVHCLCALFGGNHSKGYTPSRDLMLLFPPRLQNSTRRDSHCYVVVPYQKRQTSHRNPAKLPPRDQTNCTSHDRFTKALCTHSRILKSVIQSRSLHNIPRVLKMWSAKMNHMHMTYIVIRHWTWRMFLIKREQDGYEALPLGKRGSRHNLACAYMIFPVILFLFISSLVGNSFTKSYVYV